MKKITFLPFFFLLAIIASNNLYGQQVSIINYSTNANGQVELQVNSSADKYYILKIRHHIDSAFQIATSMMLGNVGTTTITEPLAAYPLDHYQVLEYPISTPIDTDADGLDDLTEFQNIPNQSPINAAPSINIHHGLVFVDSFSTFKELAVVKDYVQWSEFLNGKEFLKFIITDFKTDSPKVYFINSKTYSLHEYFANTMGIDYLGDNVKKGQIIYHPTAISNNGTLGTFAFNYSNGYEDNFESVQRVHELLAANMGFIENNLSYFIIENQDGQYNQNIALFQNSRIPILFEADAYAGLNYWGLNQAEGFGFFRQMTLNETPGAKDIVLYQGLPNTLPRVGGIMTSVIQTPLSHVNLRAIQNNIPNAFIRNPLAIDSIANLLNHYVYFKVEQSRYFIREATLDEVNAWFEDIRPKTEQTPPLNLDYTTILPLEDITFTMFDGFGTKCANIATMRTFGFPDGVIPDGFGVPFYFYQEFMAYNDFFTEAETMINDADFQADRAIRETMLKAFRKKIKDAEMPNWMLNELATMQNAFPQGTSIRCRSSSNNEDLEGFNGAGLYDSKTQHPDEGHISKSIQQVYASLWNLRAFEEREFYRVNHFVASMGVLCHPNFEDEIANGVGVSSDPVYNTKNNFYLNTQIGENLITNPNLNSVPEEMLINRYSDDYIVIQHSNLIPNDTTIMGTQHLDEMRNYLSTIHDDFAILYNAVNNETFAMDIEYKITIDNQLIIKQARPWVSYVSQDNSGGNNGDKIHLKIFPNPANEYIIVQCADCNLTKIRIVNIAGQQVQAKIISANNLNIEIFIKNLPSGVYIVSGFSEIDGRYYSAKFVKE